MRRLLVLALTLAAGCSDALEQKSSAGQVIAVVDSGARTLSLISATDFTVSTRDWQSASATPGTIDGHGNVFLVPLGQANAVGVDLLPGPCPPGALCVRPDYVLPLDAGSGATGVAIQDDSIAWVANPKLNTVTRLNYRSGDTTSIIVGVEDTRRGPKSTSATVSTISWFSFTYFATSSTLLGNRATIRNDLLPGCWASTSFR